MTVWLNPSFVELNGGPILTQPFGGGYILSKIGFGQPVILQRIHRTLGFLTDHQKTILQRCIRGGLVKDCIEHF